MKTERVSIEMRMPECYSDMHDSEKGLTGGTGEHEARGSSAKPLVGGGGIAVATVGIGIARMGSANNPNRGAQIAGAALALTGLTGTFVGLFLVD